MLGRARNARMHRNRTGRIWHSASVRRSPVHRELNFTLVERRGEQWIFYRNVFSSFDVDGSIGVAAFLFFVGCFSFKLVRKHHWRVRNRVIYKSIYKFRFITILTFCRFLSTFNFWKKHFGLFNVLYREALQLVSMGFLNGWVGYLTCAFKWKLSIR